MNDELRALFEADQADRRSGARPETMARDATRRRRVRELLAAGAVVDGPDHYQAAMVFQHGGSAESYRLARELALRAVELGHRPARWLAAAALDRLLVHQGQRQKYGTQFRRWGDDLRLVEVDPATTDAERAEWDVPPLPAARARASGTVPPDPSAPVLLGDVEVRIYRTPALAPAGASVVPEPLETPPKPTPWLPEGVRIARAGHGWSAVTADGSWSVSWTSLPMSADQPVLIAWDEARGEPRTEVVVLAGGPAALVEGDVEGVRTVVRPAGPEAGWLVIGRASREDVLRVAESLPDRPAPSDSGP